MSVEEMRVNSKALANPKSELNNPPRAPRHVIITRLEVLKPPEILNSEAFTDLSHKELLFSRRDQIRFV